MPEVVIMTIAEVRSVVLVMEPGESDINRGRGRVDDENMPDWVERKIKEGLTPMIKWIEYRVMYAWGYSKWVTVEVAEHFDIADRDYIDGLADDERVNREDEHFRKIEIRDVEPSTEYLQARLDRICKELKQLKSLQEIYLAKLKERD